MKKLFLLMLSFLIASLSASYGYSQEIEETDKVLIIREAKQVRRDIVAIEGWLSGEILEVRVEVRMYSERPKIGNVALVGPGIGRLSYIRKEEIPLSLEEADPYQITKKGGLLSFGKKKRTEKPKGTLTQELFKIKIPVNKIIPGKNYQIWVDVESKTTAGRAQKHKFKLKDFSKFLGLE